MILYGMWMVWRYTTIYTSKNHISVEELSNLFEVALVEVGTRENIIVQETMDKVPPRYREVNK